jgi:hypothetical protein
MRCRNIYSILFLFMICGCAIQLRDETELQLFPTKIDINEWNIEIPPTEMSAEEKLKDSRSKLFEEYHVQNVYRAIYSGGDRKTKITYDIITTETSLDAYSLMRRFCTNIETYDSRTESYISNISVLMSRGKCVVDIRYESEYENSREELHKAIQFVQERTVQETIPGEAAALVRNGEGPVLYRNPMKELYDEENYFWGTVIADEKTTVIYWIKDDKISASRLYDKILKSQRGIVVESMSVRSFYYRKDDKYFVFVQKDFVVLGVLAINKQGVGNKTAMSMINCIYEASLKYNRKENN